MGNEKLWSADIQKDMLESAQYGEETRTARGKRKMEGKNQGKNIYKSVSFSRVFGIIEFLFIYIYFFIPQFKYMNFIYS